MHRTTGDDYVTIGSLPNQHIDQSLPGTPGTTLSAEFANALQEEIINVIEEAGITIETDPAIDRSNGFIQLKDALFSSQALDTLAIKDDAINDDKISDVSLSKLINGTTDIAVSAGGFTDYLWIKNDGAIYRRKGPDGSTYPYDQVYFDHLSLSTLHMDNVTTYQRSWIQKDEIKIESVGHAIYDNYKSDWSIDSLEFLRERDDGTIDNFLRVSVSDGFYISRIGSAVTTKDVSLNYDGLKFYDSSWRIRHKVLLLPSSGWSEVGGSYTYLIDTGIVNTAKIIAGHFTIKSSSGIVYAMHSSTYEVEHLLFTEGASTYTASIKLPYDPQGASFTDRFITLWYTEGG